MEKYLWIAGALPFIILGTIHMLYTFFSKKLTARDSLVNDQMKISFPILTKETTMWRSWIGFNASHSTGALYFGTINLVIAVQFPELIHNQLFQCISFIVVAFYTWLAKKYWFTIPLVGMLLSFLLFLSAIIMMV